MLVMLKEINGTKITFRTINSNFVKSIRANHITDTQSVIEMEDGSILYVEGDVNKITRKMNGDNILHD